MFAAVHDRMSYTWYQVPATLVHCVPGILVEQLTLPAAGSRDAHSFEHA